MGRQVKARERERQESAQRRRPWRRGRVPAAARTAPAHGHASVLLAEVLELLAPRSGGRYVDGTLGLGGHAEALLQGSAPDGTLLGCDRDAEALARARERLAAFAGRVSFVQADFRELPAHLGEGTRDGILLDLGVSSLQLDAAERGFSFRLGGPLDMRMDRSRGETAAELLARVEESELADILHEWGEEPRARQVARAIVAARAQAPLATTTALAEVVRRAAGPSRPGLDAATRTFQALRIHVNRELSGLREALGGLAHCLAAGGRLAVIAFHSLEDREVKTCFRELPEGEFRLLTRKPLRPGPDELEANPRARSARLRAVERLGAAA